MDGSYVWRRWIAAPLAAALIALVATPTAEARQSPVIVTVIDPAGARTVTAAQMEHWADVAAASTGGARTAKRLLQAQALQLLISFAWIEGEARAQGIAVTDGEVQLSFEEHLQQFFPMLSDFRKFLRTSRQTRKDVLERVRLDLLANEIRDRVASTAPAVTEADIDAFIAEHGPIETPERRDLRLVLAKTQVQAQEARRALERGAAWSQVARRYSIDETRGEPLRDVTKNDLDPLIRRAVFRARRGRLLGPLKTPYGYYVVKVSRIRPAAPVPVREHRQIVRETLESEAEQQALEAFVKTFTATWRARTVCAAAYDWHSDCSNWDGTKVVPDNS